MKFSLLAFVSCLSMAGLAQSNLSEWQSLVNAENAFAQLAKTKSAVEAFQANLAGDAVVFSKGEAVNAAEFWSKLQPDQSLLFWWPLFADISVSGDVGYTTGPYQWGESKTNPPSSFGYYSTVWKKNTTGKWKVAVDLGISVDKPEKDDVPLVQGPKSAYKKTVGFDFKKSLAHLQSIEKEYNQGLTRDGKSFDPAMLSSDARIHRSGSSPFTSTAVIRTISEQGSGFIFTGLGIDLSSAGDMAYTYGKVKKTLKKDGIAKEFNSNYLRVWKTTDGKSWKIVLDVIGD